MKSMSESIKEDGQIISNSLWQPVERLFGLYCQEKGIPLALVEHGITLGLSQYAKYQAQYWGTLQGDTGVYHWPTSLNDMDSEKIVKHKQCIFLFNYLYF